MTKNKWLGLAALGILALIAAIIKPSRAGIRAEAEAAATRIPGFRHAVEIVVPRKGKRAQRYSISRPDYRPDQLEIERFLRLNISICDSRGLNPAAQKALRISSEQAGKVNRLIASSIEDFRNAISSRITLVSSKTGGETIYRVESFKDEATEIRENFEYDLAQVVGRDLAREMATLPDRDDTYLGAGRYDLEFVICARKSDDYGSDSEWSIIYTAYLPISGKRAIGGMPIPSDEFISGCGIFSEGSAGEPRPEKPHPNLAQSGQ